MSNVKTLQGRILCTQVHEDTRVVIDDAFSILVPRGMKLSTDQNEIGGDKLFACFAPVPNSLKLIDDSFDMQYSNSQMRFYINSDVKEFEGFVDLGDEKIRKSLETSFINSLQEQNALLGLSGGRGPFVVKSDCQAVIVASDRAFLGTAGFILLLSSGLYTGGYFVAERPDPKEFEMNPAAPSAYKKAIKQWLETVRPVESGQINKGGKSENASETANQPNKNALGPYAAENGKLDAILVSRLFSEDVLFFPETLIERTANGVHINPQVNAQKQGEHPFIVQNIQAFTPALFDLFAQLDTNKELHLPKSKIHQKMLRPLLDDRLTGLSFLNLMAYHMVKIVEKNDNPNEYLAVVDQNVIAGIPDAFQYICKFILACRKYNEKQGAFTVQFASAINLDSPISGKLTPVAGSAQGKMVAGMCSFTVQADGTITEGDSSSINTDSGKPKRQPGTSKPKPTGKKSNDEVGKAQQKEEVSQALSKEDKQKGSDKLAEDRVDKAADEKAVKRRTEEALRDWQLACNQINTERAKLVDKWKSELHAKYDRQLAELEEAQSNECTAHSKKCAELSEKTAQLQKELETAGLFAFSKKKELKAKIFDAQTDESNAAKEGANLNTRQTNEKKALQDALSKELSSLSQKAEKKLPYPAKSPEVLAAEKEKAAQEERERKAQEEKKKEEERKKAEAEARAEEQKLKDEIFDILICSTSYEGMTATEITKNLWPSNQSYSGAPDPILCNKVITALKKLRDEGQISVSVINGRPYFRIN